MTECGMSESVKELVGGRMRTEKLKRKFEKLAGERLGGGDLRESLGEELMPAGMSKGFLEALNALTKQVEDADDARELLVRARDRRLGVRGASNDEKLRVADVKAAMEEVMARGVMRSQITEAEAGDEPEPESGLESNSESELEGVEEEPGWGCECAKRGTTAVAEHAMDILKGKGLEKRVEIVGMIKDETWSRMCH